MHLFEIYNFITLLLDACSWAFVLARNHVSFLLKICTGNIPFLLHFFRSHNITSRAFGVTNGIQ